MIKKNKTRQQCTGETSNDGLMKVLAVYHTRVVKMRDCGRLKVLRKFYQKLYCRLYWITRVHTLLTLSPSQTSLQITSISRSPNPFITMVLSLISFSLADSRPITAPATPPSSTMRHRLYSNRKSTVTGSDQMITQA